MAPISLVQELANFHPDVIHNHSMGSMGLQAFAAAHLLGIPILRTRHVFLAGFLKYAQISIENFYALKAKRRVSQAVNPSHHAGCFEGET